MPREYNSSLMVACQEQREFSHGLVPARHLLHCAQAVNVRWKVKARAALCPKALTSPQLLATAEDGAKSGFSDLC